MTPTELKEARLKLGLSLEQMATMLGYVGLQRRQMQHDLETGVKPFRECQKRLLTAYIEGYRPKDWPPIKD